MWQSWQLSARSLWTDSDHCAKDFSRSAPLWITSWQLPQNSLFVMNSLRIDS